METSLVTTKGQVVIPAAVRERHGIRKGTRVYFIESGNEIIMRPVTDEFIEAKMGSLKTGGRALRFLLAERRREYGK